jgi:hypothetical protein
MAVGFGGFLMDGGDERTCRFERVMI